MWYLSTDLQGDSKERSGGRLCCDNLLLKIWLLTLLIEKQLKPSVNFFLVRLQTYCILDATYFFGEIEFISFQQSKSSFVVVGNSLGNEIDQVGFILTAFHEFGKISWDFRNWRVNHEKYWNTMIKVFAIFDGDFLICISNRVDTVISFW